MKGLIILALGSVLCTTQPAIQEDTYEDTSIKQTVVEETVTVKDTQTVGTDYYMGNYDLTFYCPCKKCCGKSPGQKGYGITATGTVATEGRTIGVDPKVIPYGSQVYIEGFGWYIAEDTGGGIRNKHIDIYVSSHSKALQLGRQTAEVWVRK